MRFDFGLTHTYLCSKFEKVVRVLAAAGRRRTRQPTATDFRCTCGLSFISAVSLDRDDAIPRF